MKRSCIAGLSIAVSLGPKRKDESPRLGRSRYLNRKSHPRFFSSAVRNDRQCLLSGVTIASRLKISAGRQRISTRNLSLTLAPVTLIKALKSRVLQPVCSLGDLLRVGQRAQA